MPKKEEDLTRVLKPGQPVILVWVSGIGATEIPAKFAEYIQGEFSERTPKFTADFGDVTGERCFWILPNDVRIKSVIEWQKLVAPVQCAAFAMAQRYGERTMDKVGDPALTAAGRKAQAIEKARQTLVDKLGFDPTDDSWVEEHLADSDVERAWFRFCREQGLPIANTETLSTFKTLTGVSLTADEADRLSRKRMRFLMGAFKIRWAGEKEPEKWVHAAKDFERRHREREIRMAEWAERNKGAYPAAVCKQPIRFHAGPFLEKCLLRIPQAFTDTTCSYVKPGVALRIFGYDPVDGWADLDFCDELRMALTGTLHRGKDGWYAMIIRPDEVQTHLEGFPP